MSIPLKISIITPSFNQGQFIEKTIQSVLNQDYKNFEHIIVDGKSTDNTIEVLKKYPHLKWISEPDEGQSDALNKALFMATGDIIGWINSDDYYVENVFSDVASHFEDESVNWIIGRTSKLYDESNEIIIGPYKPVSRKSLAKDCDNIRTNAAFYRKKILDEVGGLNKNFHMVMDYDLFVRLSKLYEPQNINVVYIAFRVHKDQKTSYRNMRLQFTELCKVFIREKYWFALLLKTYKNIKIIAKRPLKMFLIRTGILDKKFQNRPVRS